MISLAEEKISLQLDHILTHRVIVPSNLFSISAGLRWTIPEAISVPMIFQTIEGLIRVLLLLGAISISVI